MTYSPTTRIGSKYSNHPAIGQPDLIYGYDINGWTHQPRVIYDFYSHNRLQLYWDRNGNLRQIQPDEGYARFHLWDDDNKLVVSVGATTCGYYGNASDGLRAYKMSGDFYRSSVNGGSISGVAYFDNTTLYPNRFMTLSMKNYTKHYFMGSERFCSTIGGGNKGYWLVYPYDNLTQQEQSLLYTLQNDYTYRHYYNDIYDYAHSNNQTHNTDYTGTVEQGDQFYDYYQYHSDEQYYGNISLEFKTPFAEQFDKYYNNNDEDEPYYYHSNHLGSAAWITDTKGLPVQYIMYAPYGEERLNQHPFSYRERFTFTGKERDIETGYDYFGARNYLSALSIWGAVDPLANKYIYNSPYVYCDGNPIGYIDPDGKGVFPSAKALREAGRQAMSNPDYQPGVGGTTHCNQGAQAINAMANDRSVTGRANDMYKYLSDENNATSLTQTEALEYAQQGVVVFASYYNDQKNESGHIAVVAPTDNLTYSGDQNGYVVSVFNIGRKNGEMPLGYAFGTRPVKLFVLNADIERLNNDNALYNGGILDGITVTGVSTYSRGNLTNPATIQADYDIQLNL